MKKNGSTNIDKHKKQEKIDNIYQKVLIIVAAVIIIIVCVLLIGKAIKNASDPKVYTLTSFENTLTNPETGINYVACNMSVKAVNYGQLYATLGENKYYGIQFEEQTRFIAEEDEAIGYVYRAESIEDITVENFEPIAAYIYAVGKEELKVDTLIAEAKYLAEEDRSRDDLQDDSVYTYAIRDALINAERVVAPTNDNLDDKYTLQIRLLSEKYPGLYYNVLYLRDKAGISYLYNRGTKEAVIAPEITNIRFYGE